MTVYLRRWKRPDGAVSEAYVYDFSVRLPGEHRARRFRGSVPGSGLNRRQAENFERGFIAQVMSGSFDAERLAKTAERIPTLAEYAPVYLTACEAIDSTCGAREAQSRRTIVERYLKPFFGDMALDQITTEIISEFVHAQTLAPKPKGPAGFSAKTIKNHIAVLSGLLRHACPKHLRAVPRIRWPKLPKPRPRFYTFEQAEALLGAAKAEPFWYAMILVALRCGLRIGELQALEWRHVDFRSRAILVDQAFSKKVLKRPKNGKTRSIPMPPSVSEALKTHPRRLGSPWVWPSSDGDAMKQNEVKHPMWRALERAGLPADQWHICRHTFCSHLVMRGVHLQVVMELAGHSSFEVTLRYAHLAPQVHAEAIARLDAPVPNAEQPEKPKRRSGKGR